MRMSRTGDKNHNKKDSVPGSQPGRRNNVNETDGKTPASRGKLLPRINSITIDLFTIKAVV